MPEITPPKKRVKFRDTYTVQTGLPNPPTYLKDSVYAFDASTAEYWCNRGLGEIVEEGTPSAPATMDRMSLDELKRFATDCGVMLGDAKSKPEVLACVRAAINARGAENQKASANISPKDPPKEDKGGETNGGGKDKK